VKKVIAKKEKTVKKDIQNMTTPVKKNTTKIMKEMKNTMKNTTKNMMKRTREKMTKNPRNPNQVERQKIHVIYTMSVGYSPVYSADKDS